MTTEGLRTEYYTSIKNSKSEGFFATAGFFLIGAVLISSLFIAKDVFSISSTKVAPASLSISNVTDRSLTIAWKTSSLAQGYIVYGVDPENLTYKAYDNQESGSTINSLKTTNHAVTLVNLKPNTYYYYKIISGNTDFDSLEGKILEPIKTASVSPFAQSEIREEIQN